MDEVDNIILHTLRNAGCDIDDEIISLKQFDELLVVKAAVCCLEAIHPGTGLPRSLPPSMSLRLRISTNIAQMIQDLGYRGDMGYQTILYCNEIDIRRMFMFLVERLPKESDKSIQSKVKGQLELLENEIKTRLQKSLQSQWTKPNEKSYLAITRPFKSKFITAPLTHSKNITQAMKEYWARYLLPVNEQCSKNELLPSLICSNCECFNTQSKFVPILNDITQMETQLQTLVKQSNSINKDVEDISINIFNTDKNEINKSTINVDISDTKDILDVDTENSIEIIKDDIERLKKDIASQEDELKILKAKEIQTAEQKKTEETELLNTVKKLKIKSKTHKLLADKEENIKSLEELLETSTAKLEKLAAQWNKHRVDLIEEYRNLKEQSSHKQSESKKIEVEYETEEKKCQTLLKEIAYKESLYKNLHDEYSKKTDNISRSAYTKRIMEIIVNIKKQTNEIDKILKDTKELQKDINSLTGKLDRTFIIVDEVIFRDAKEDAMARKAYKLLATLHSECGELVQLATDIGATIRESRDLQEQVEAEKTRDTAARLNRITADLEQIQSETKMLQATLAKKS